MMSKALAILSFLLALEGCTSVKPPPKVEVPIVWAQKPDEVGKLQTGKVVSVSLEQKDESDHFRAGTNTPIVVPIGGVLFPMNVNTSGWPSPFRKMQQFYRYSIKQKNSADIVYWDDFVVYPIGSCVALRDQPYPMIVPALPQACE
jgi:hypothetical protein